MAKGIEEFRALRAEILTSIQAQHSIVLSGTPILTGLLGIGVTLFNFNLLVASIGIFVITSALAVALVSLWMAEESRRVRASFYIATELETREDLGLGWERFVHTPVEELKDKHDPSYHFPSTAFSRHYRQLGSGAIFTLIVMFVAAFLLFNAVSVYHLYVTFRLASDSSIFYLGITILALFDISYAYYLLVSPGRFLMMPKLIQEERELGRKKSNR